MKRGMAFLTGLLLAVQCASGDICKIVAWGVDDGTPFEDYGQVTSTPTGMDFRAVSAGSYHNLALMKDGSLLSWGQDTFDQVTDTPSGTDFIAVAAGAGHSTALKSDGSLVSWGYDSDGQVADTPTDSNYVAVAAGNHHCLALMNTGAIKAWGDDTNNKVSGTPSGTDFIAIATKGDHNLALKNDGTLVSWGFDNYNQVSNTPADSGYVSIAAGGYHSMALKEDGALVSWGWDFHGQVSGTPSDRDYIAIGCGRFHSLAIRNDGSVAAWGRNDWGEVSDAPTGGNLVFVDGGTNHSVALRSRSLPELINYQGRLEDDMGDPLNGVEDLTFRFYSNATGGTLLLVVLQEDVQVTDGIFNLLLGSGQLGAKLESSLGDVFMNHPRVWMSTEVGTDGEMSPRVRIASVPYALTAGDLSHVKPRDLPPAAPVEGDVYWDARGHVLMGFDGSSWRACW